VKNLVQFEASYDEHNRLKQYRFSDSGAYYKIEYDAIGRVWKRTDMSDVNTHYYYTGAKLLQELDSSYNVKTDYLASARRYMPDEADGDKYRYYVRDHQGSVIAMTDHEQNKEEYVYDSWGDHVDVDSLPSAANRIRYAGVSEMP